MRSLSHYSSLILLTGALSAGSLNAQAINVSKAVTGVFTATPSLVFTVPNGTPNATLGYYPVVHARTGADAFDMYPGGWAGMWANASFNPSITRQTNAPGAVVLPGGEQLSYAKSYTQLGKAGMNPQSKQSTQAALFAVANTQYTGSASTSYAMQMQHFGATAQDYFLSIAAPEIKRTMQPAYRLEPGSNGGTYVYYAPNNAKSRASVDVYADGLPIWSSETAYAFPTGASDPFAKHELKWGQTPSNVTLYLGRFSTGQSVRLSVVVRTDVGGRSTQCGDESSWGFITRHCMDLQESVLLPPSGSSTVPGVHLHTRKTSLVFTR